MKTNYPAVLVSAIAYWLLGAIWYALLFGKPFDLVQTHGAVLEPFGVRHAFAIA